MTGTKESITSDLMTGDGFVLVRKSSKMCSRKKRGSAAPLFGASASADENEVRSQSSRLTGGSIRPEAPCVVAQVSTEEILRAMSSTMSKVDTTPWYR